MNALIRYYLYKSMITSYEYKHDKDETHVVTQFDYDNFANHIINSQKAAQPAVQETK